MQDTLRQAPFKLHGLSESKMVRRPRKIFLLNRLTEGEESNFEEIYAIDNIDYVIQAIDLADIFQKAIEPQDLRFNTEKAKQAIENYNNSLPPDEKKYKVAIMQTLNTTESQQHKQVSAMVGKLIQVLKDAIGVALNPTSIDQIAKGLEDAFTNLDEQKDDAWIFWEKKTGEKTTYQYNILFAVQDTTTGHLMVALPMGLEIEVYTNYEKVLGITIHDEESYTVRVKAMKVAQLLRADMGQLATRTRPSRG